MNDDNPTAASHPSRIPPVRIYLRGVEVEESDSGPGHDGVDLLAGRYLRLLRDDVVRRVRLRLCPAMYMYKYRVGKKFNITRNKQCCQDTLMSVKREAGGGSLTAVSWTNEADPFAVFVQE